MSKNILEELIFNTPAESEPEPVVPAEASEAAEPTSPPAVEAAPAEPESVPTPAPVEAAPAAPVAPVVPEGEPAPEDYKAKADFLANELERVLGLRARPEQAPSAPTTSAPAPSPTPAPVVPEAINFFKDDDEFVETINNRESFNALLNKVYQQGRQNTLKDIPVLVDRQVEERLSIELAARDFYAKNPDLVQHKGYIALIANELQAQHPDYGLDKLLLETESEARKRLVVAKPATAATPAKPAFATPPNARPAAPAKPTNPVQADVDSMFKAING